MPKELPYTSSIKDMPLMFREMKRTAQLLSEGKTGEEIVRLSLAENIYQLDKVKRRRDVPLRMVKRLSTLGGQLVDVVADGSGSEAKLAAFLALIKADRLVFEYMREVYADRLQTGNDEVTDKDFLDFIERKAQNNETVARWTPPNLVNIRGKIKTSICEAGLAKRKGDALLIQKPIFEPGFCELLDASDKPYARAMLLEV